jgi:hypothetical protein
MPWRLPSHSREFPLPSSQACRVYRVSALYRLYHPTSSGRASRTPEKRLDHDASTASEQVAPTLLKGSSRVDGRRANTPEDSLPCFAPIADAP